MTHTPARAWFVTGCSTGFGRLLAEEVLSIAASESTTTGADFPEGE